MLNIPKKFIVNEENEKVGVVLDLTTYEKIEEVLENYGLAKLMEEVMEEESLSLRDARRYYRTLKKRP